MTTRPLPAPAESTVWLELNGTPVWTWLCTPARLDALACGWLRTEGWIVGREELAEIHVDHEELRVTARTASEVRAPERTLSTGPGRAAFTLERIPSEPARDLADPPSLIESGRLRTSFQEMFRRCSLRREGGGVHSGALLDADGVSHVIEDVGRHNVVDKVIGAAMLADRPLEERVLLLSGRISAEIAVKAWRSGLAAMATLSVPTSLACEIADRAGVTLVGRALTPSPFHYRPRSSGDSG